MPVPMFDVRISISYCAILHNNGHYCIIQRDNAPCTVCIATAPRVGIGSALPLRSLNVQRSNSCGTFLSACANKSTVTQSVRKLLHSNALSCLKQFTHAFGSVSLKLFLSVSNRYLKFENVSTFCIFSFMFFLFSTIYHKSSMYC